MRQPRVFAPHRDSRSSSCPLILTQISLLSVLPRYGWRSSSRRISFSPERRKNPLRSFAVHVPLLSGRCQPVSESGIAGKKGDTTHPASPTIGSGKARRAKSLKPSLRVSVPWPHSAGETRGSSLFSSTHSRPLSSARSIGIKQLRDFEPRSDSRISSCPLTLTRIVRLPALPRYG